MNLFNIMRIKQCNEMKKCFGFLAEEYLRIGARAVKYINIANSYLILKSIEIVNVQHIS